MTSSLKFNRVLLKISGEALLGDQEFGLDPAMVSQVCADVRSGIDLGAQVALVVGGGNLFRGVALAAQGADRVSGDHMGMLATVMNGIALKMELQKQGVDASLLSAIPMPDICETFSQRASDAHLADGRVVIFVAGLGHPFLTTDTGAAMRAAEIGADVLMKATNVDGVYSADPRKDPSASRFDVIDHDDILARGLQVLDTAAVALARDIDIPIAVFSIHESGQFAEILRGGGRFTLVKDR